MNNPATFADRIVYREKDKFEAMRCDVCGAAPVIIWKQETYMTTLGWIVMVPESLSCPNGSHEATDQEYRTMRQELQAELNATIERSREAMGQPVRKSRWAK